MGLRFRLEYHDYAGKFGCHFGGLADYPERYEPYLKRIVEYHRKFEKSYPLPMEKYRAGKEFRWGEFNWGACGRGWAIVVEEEPEANEWGEVAP